MNSNENINIKPSSTPSGVRPVKGEESLHVVNYSCNNDECGVNPPPPRRRHISATQEMYRLKKSNPLYCRWIKFNAARGHPSKI